MDATAAHRAASSIGKVRELDGLRGLLSLLVVLNHLNGSSLPWVWGCMDLFFALSGYLIGRGSLQHRHQPNFWWVYLRRRVVRIWPLYFAVLGFACAAAWIDVHYFHAPEESLSWRVLQCVFFVQNSEFYWQPFTNGWGPGYPIMFGHAWSLALEEQFYLLAPLLAWLMFAAGTWLTKRSGWLPWAVLALFLIACNLLRAEGIYTFLLLGRLDAFVLGTLVAVVEARSHAEPASSARAGRWFSALLIPGGGMAAVLALYSYSPSAPGGPLGLNAIPGVSVFAIFAAVLIGAIIFRRAPGMTAFLGWGPLRYAGTISYSTYLWHVPVMVLMTRMFWRASWIPGGYGLHAGLMASVSLTIAHFSYRLIEAPMLRAKPDYDRAYAGQPAQSPA
ncbi:MAG TPA: acyltransferase [Steroidobacteraceae bacterium]|nr:acyltransferase [Steroidobacteraceae bacterium]